MMGAPSGFSRYWKTPPEGSSTTNSRRVMWTGLVSRSVGTSQGSVGQGVVSGLGSGRGVATATGVGAGVGTVAGVLGAPLPPPQEITAAPNAAAKEAWNSFIETSPS